MYSQFIHGKFEGDTDSGYRLVARSRDLLDETRLTALVQTKRFWRKQAPKSQVKAVGVFPFEDYVVLFKAEFAHRHEQPVWSGCRDFIQHRYIFIPKTAIAIIQSKTFHLVNWLWDQPIPIYTKFDDDLPSLPIPILETPIGIESSQDEIEKVQACFKEMDAEGRSLLLSAVAAAIQKQPVLLNVERVETCPEKYLESILLLLPAACRSNIAMAAGTLDEHQLEWANLLIKSHSVPQGKLPDNMLGLNRQSQKMIGKFDNALLSPEYIKLLHLILSTPKQVGLLLQRLNMLSDPSITLESLSRSEVIVNIIPILPEEQRETTWSQYLSGLQPDQWKVAICIMEPAGQDFSWQALQSLTLQDPPQYLPIVMLLWQSITARQVISRWAYDLINNLKLAELLLTQGLLEKLHVWITDAAIAKQLRILSLEVISYQTQQNLDEDKQLAHQIITSQFFQETSDRLALWDATLTDTITVEALCSVFNRRFIFLFAHLKIAQWQTSRLFSQLKQLLPKAAHLMDALITKRSAALGQLPYVAKVTGMSRVEQDMFCRTCLSTWKPNNLDVRDFLVELFKQNRRTNKRCWQEEFPETYAWFSLNLSKVWIQAIAQLEQDDSLWTNWHQLATALYDLPQDQLIFLDQVVGDRFRINVIQTWLPLLTQTLVSEAFVASTAWRTLQQHELNSLITGFTDQSLPAAITLARYLRDTQRADWVVGLLYYLVEIWVSQKRMPDEDLVILLINPEVTQAFSTDDWLKLTRLRWSFQISQRPQGEPEFCPKDKAILADYAREALQGYTLPTQTRQLLSECKAWGLSLIECLDILLKASPRACDISTVLFYHHSFAHLPDSNQRRNLEGLLLQVPILNKSDRADLKASLVDILTQKILPCRDFERLEWWRNKAFDQELYLAAFTSAVQSFVPTLNLLDLKIHLQELQKHFLIEESEIMAQVLLRYIPTVEPLA